jgi:hypothetical protein
MTKRNVASVECSMEYHIPKTTIAYAPPPPFHNLIFNQKSNKTVSLCTDTKQSGMDTVTEKHTASIFTQPAEDVSSTFLWNTANQTTSCPNLDRTMFLHHCEHLK